MAVAKGVKSPGLLSEVGIARMAAVTILLLGALVLQQTLLTRVTILGVIPQILFVVIVSLAYTEGEGVGVVVGFFGGLLIDLRLPPDSIVGLTALVYTLIGFGVGSFRKYSAAESVWTPVIVIALASAAAETSYATMSIIFGQQWVSLQFTAKTVGLVVLYNTLMTPFVFPIVRRIAERFRPERVYRW